MEFEIINEIKDDYREVENLTREAFWNLYVPGCNEHYLVHIMRDHTDFIPELDFIAVHEDQIIGNIMYARSKVIKNSNPKEVIDTISFGPVSVLPDYQKKGVGSALIKHSLKAASEMGFKAVIILGHPSNYCKHGFVNSKDLGVSDQDGKYPFSLLALELEKGVFKGDGWRFHASDVYDFNPEEAEKFDMKFEIKEKKVTPSQVEFSIAYRAFLI